MLVVFKSKVAGDIYMYEENAKPILELLGKEFKQGIITAAETGEAIAKLEAELARRKDQEAHDRAEREAKMLEENDALGGRDKYQPVTPEPVSFTARTYPLLEMLVLAHKKGQDIVWGV